MGETSDQIERHIQETRNDLGDNFSELEDKVKTAVDWRAQFEQRPGTMLALAFGGGMVLSALLPSGRRSRSTYDEGWKSATNRDSTPSLQSAATPPTGKPSETRQTVEALTGALVGVAVSRASRFIDSLLPGFEREFSNAKTAKSAYSYRPDSGNFAESNAPPKSSAASGD
jgi:hypothetical protein